MSSEFYFLLYDSESNPLLHILFPSVTDEVPMHSVDQVSHGGMVWLSVDLLSEGVHKNTLHVTKC